MEQQQSFKWYSAYKIIALVASILGVLSCITVPFSFLTLSRIHIPPELGLDLQLITRDLLWQSLAISLVSTLIFFLAYWALQKEKKWGMLVIYTQNIVMPLAPLALIPAFNRYFSSLLLSMEQISGAMLFPTPMRQLLLGLFPAVMGFSALVMLVLYTLNSIYFRKRKDVFVN